MTGVLVHEWIAQAGGSENVFEAMSRVYPESDLVCLWNDSENRFDPERLRETWLARTPLRKSKAGAVPFMPATWRMLRGGEYDWALISSHLFAHHVNFHDRDLPRYVYVHTPARYIWNPELDARGASLPARAVASALKPLDRRRAREGASFAANSAFVRARIADAWGVDSVVIHPPVEVTDIQSQDWAEGLVGDERAAYDALPAEFVLGASRFIPYKRMDLVIAAGEAAGLPVVLAGNGPELPKLRELAAEASVPITFVLSPSNALLWALYARTSVYVFPAVEDFGIMPVEAMAAGAPVVAPGIGGTSETVVDGVTGAHVDFASTSDLAAALSTAIATDRADRTAHAQSFSRERFAERLREWVGR